MENSLCVTLVFICLICRTRLCHLRWGLPWDPTKPFSSAKRGQCVGYALWRSPLWLAWGLAGQPLSYFNLQWDLGGRSQALLNHHFQNVTWWRKHSPNCVSLAIGLMMCMRLRQYWESRGYYVSSPKIKWIYTSKEAGPKLHFTQCLFIVNNVNSSWCFGMSSFSSSVFPNNESCISCPHRLFVCFHAFLKETWLSHGHEPLLGKLK